MDDGHERLQEVWRRAKDLFPETESSKNTGPMNTQLRSMLHTEVARMFADPSKIDEIVAEGVAAGHRILTIHLGEPPKSFDWEWTDEKGEFHRDGEITPVEFWNKYVDAGLEDYVCLVDDPRAEHPRARRSPSSTWAMWRAATRPSTSTCRTSS